MITFLPKRLFSTLTETGPARSAKVGLLMNVHSIFEEAFSFLREESRIAQSIDLSRLPIKDHDSEKHSLQQIMLLEFMGEYILPTLFRSYFSKSMNVSDPPKNP